MRLILFFDLPVITKKQRKIYASFRKYLIQQGYLMIQFSVYVKIFNNRDSAVKHTNMLHKNVPQEGHLRILLVTEKQYAKMQIIIGGKTNQETIITINPVIYL